MIATKELIFLQSSSETNVYIHAIFLDTKFTTATHELLGSSVIPQRFTDHFSVSEIILSAKA